MRLACALAAASLLMACSDESDGPAADVRQPDTRSADLTVDAQADAGLDALRTDGQPDTLTPDTRPDRALDVLLPDTLAPDAPAPDAPAPDTLAPDTLATDGGVPPPSTTTVIFADDGKKLYWVDPTTLQVFFIGSYIWPTGTPTGSQVMTDLAVDSAGNVFGVAWGVLYKVDAYTATLTKVGSMTQQYNGLSFGMVPATGDGGTAKELLLGLTKAGTADTALYAIDTSTAVETLIGQPGTGYKSSGDIVYNAAVGLLATLEPTPTGNDRLASLSLSNGAATLIGDVGYDDFWGIAFWKGKVLGFRDTGEIAEINATTGAATIKKTTSIQWYSAGVTTAAPTGP